MAMMNRYQVFDGSDWIEVEATSPREAVEIAFDPANYDPPAEVPSPPKPGESREYWEYYFVEDEEGNELLRGHISEVFTCECGCGCNAAGTTTDDLGIRVCKTCAEYVEIDGEIYCARQTHNFSQCPLCDGEIHWHDEIHTYSDAGPNHLHGECPCGEWKNENRGHWGFYSYTPVPSVSPGRRSEGRNA